MRTFWGSVCLWALPLLALFWILSDAERVATKHLLEQHRTELVQVAAHYQKLSDPATRIEGFVKRVISGLERGLDCRPLVSQLGREHLEIYLFSGSGKRLQRPGFAQGFQSLSERVLSAILGFHRDPGFSLGKSEGKMLEAFLDDQGVAEMLAESPGRILDLSKAGSLKLAGWFPLASNGADLGYVLARMDSAFLPQDRVIEAARKKLTRLAGGEFTFGWVSLAESQPGHVSGIASFPPEIIEEIRRDRLDPCFQDRDRIFMTTTLENGIRLFAARRIPAPSRVYHDWKLLLAGFAAFLGAFSIWAHRGGLSPTIRLRLVFLFGIAGATGFLLLWNSAETYLVTRKETLLRENRDKAFRLLQKVDTDFQNSLEASAHPFRQMLDEWERRLARNASASSPAWDERLNGILVSAFVADSQGVFQYFFNSMPSKGLVIPWDISGKKGLSLVVQLAIARFNGISEEDEAKVVSASPVKLDHLMSLSARALSRGDREIVRNIMQGQTFNRFSAFARLPQGKAVGVVSVKFNTTRLEQRFLEKMSRRVGRCRTSDGEALHLLALPKTVGSRLRSIPRQRAYEGDVLRIHDAISQNGVFAAEMGSYQGRPSQISGVPGHFLLDYNLFLVFPFSPVQRELEHLFNRWMGLGILTIGFAVFLGNLISSNLVQPLNELTRGIVRLTHSQYRDPVLISTGDELQVIGQGIGKVMEEMQELQVAQAIQEQLVPRASLDGRGWSIKGWSRSPYEIGGDVYDYLLTPSGGVGFYVARIAGKSISSALEMAMTKMAMRVFIDLQILEPTTIFEEFQSRFGTVLPFGKKLEMCFGIFEPAERRLLTVGVGNGRMILFADGIPIPPQKEAASTDVSGIPSLWRQTFLVPKKSRIAAFSSGFLDMPISDSGTLDLEGLQQRFATLHTIAPAEVGPALFSLLDKESGSRRMNTSQTLVVLHVE